MNAANDDECARLRALRRYEVLDTGPEEEFDRITRLAAQMFEVPIALISLVDAARLWFKSRVGIDAESMPRQETFCGLALMSDGALVLPDATKDDVFCTNALVTGDPGVRFYAGAPLITDDGYRIGTLCLIDTAPRHNFDDPKVAQLRDLAALVVDALERRRENLLLQERSIQLVRQTRELERASKAKSQFLSSMSHELRTPLNAVLGFGQLLELDAANMEETHNNAVRQILKNSEHLLLLISDILDLSTIEKSQVRLNPKRIALPQLLRECAPIFEKLTGPRHVSFGGLADKAGAPVVVADVLRLKQVILNFASNAAKYNRIGGHFGITLEPGAVGHVRVVVWDTGVGIAPDQRAQLFQPFNRLGKEASRIEGTGIGLSICRELAELMGGEVGFTSEPGQGSRFWIELPMTDAQAADEGESETETLEARAC